LVKEGVHIGEPGTLLIIWQQIEYALLAECLLKEFKLVILFEAVAVVKPHTRHMRKHNTIFPFRYAGFFHEALRAAVIFFTRESEYAGLEVGKALILEE